MGPCITDTNRIKTGNNAQTPIQQFFTNKSVFITGSTGFLGKILVEKLLRSCPDISTIYILVRTKKGKHMYERIDDMLDDPVFERLKEECPKYRHKVVGISGDVGQPALGINLQDLQLLKNDVHVIFHGAATVRFDESLKIAASFNLRGVQEILKIAKEMTNLKAFVHVSTLYSQCINDEIAERFYEPQMDYKQLLTLIDSLDDEQLKEITPKLVGEHPNTYSYTKSIAEDIIRREAGDLPISIFRPAIIISTFREPVPGWIDNLYGPTGVTAASSNGLLRCCNTSTTANANLVPVDMCVNAMIGIAKETAELPRTIQRDPENYDIPIYHYESSTEAPITWKKYMGMTEKYGYDWPSINIIWYYSLVLISNKFLYNIYFFLVHTLPAFFVDGFCILTGREARLLKIYTKVKKFVAVISYFSLRTWKVDSHRVREMIDGMDKNDQNLFFCDLKKLNWEEYFIDYFKGVRIYLIKDPLTTLEAARKKTFKLYMLHQLVKCMIFYGLARLAWAIIKFVSTLVL